MLYKTFCTEAERHTSEYIVQEIKTVINEIGQSKIMGIVTDNATSMAKARKLINEEYPAITEYGCIAHSLNLLIGDIMKCSSLKNFDGQCKDIIKQITGSHIVLATFNQIQKDKKGTSLSLKLPVVTRWGSVLQCLDSLANCKFALKILVVTEEINNKLSSTVKKNCLDDEIFWKKVEKLIEILTPIVKWITKLEGDDLQMAEVVDAFKELDNSLEYMISGLPITQKEEADIMNSYQERKTKTLRPIHYAANLLDPQKRGKNLSQEEHLVAMEYISTLATLKNAEEEALRELSEYIAKTNMFSRDYIWKSANSIDPVTWWGGFGCKTSIKCLAVSILSLPPSSAATERTFSTYNFVHTAKRNKLTVKRAGMLTYIAHNLRLNKDKTLSKKAVDDEDDVDAEAYNETEIEACDETEIEAHDEIEAEDMIENEVDDSYSETEYFRGFERL